MDKDATRHFRTYEKCQHHADLQICPRKVNHHDNSMVIFQVGHGYNDLELGIFDLELELKVLDLELDLMICVCN